MSDFNVEEWTEWFVSTGDEEAMRAWLAALETFHNLNMLERWATIIELNRISNHYEQKNPPTQVVGG